MQSGPAQPANLPYEHEKRTILGLAGIYVLRLLGMYMVLPVLSLHAAGLSGATSLLVGLSVGSYGLAQAALQVPFGIWSDRYGRRRVIATGLIMFAAGSVISAVAESAWLLIVGRTLQGAGGISSAVVAFIADVSRPQIRAQAMAALGAAIGLSFGIGMIAGPGLATRVGVPGLFWLTAGLSIVAAIYVGTGIPRPPRHVHDETVEWTPGHLAEVLLDAPMRRLDLSTLILHTEVTALFVAGPPLLKAHVPLEQHGMVYAVLIPGALVLMAVTALFADRYGRLKEAVLLGALCMFGAGVFLVQNGDRMSGVVAAIGLAIAAVAFAEPAMPAMVTRMANDAARGTAAGVFHLSQYGGSFLGGILGGVLLNRPELLGTAMCAGAVLWLGLAAGLPRLRPHMHSRAAGG